MAKLRVGVAEVDYTPQVGLPLQGNFRDDYACRGVHDPLCARGMVFEGADGAKAALLSVDICMLDRDSVAAMREVIASGCDVAADCVLIAATHTHSGPSVARLAAMPTCEADVARQFLAKAASAVVAAEANLDDAQLTAGTGEEDRLSFNRRLLCTDGQTHMNWEKLDPAFVVRALGPIDPRITVLGVSQGGSLAAAAVNFALHPAILAGDNWLYSADYPGYLAEAMRRVCGGDVITAFFNGTCGNVNHLDYADPLQGRGYQMTQRVGYMLAAAAVQAIRSAAAVGGDRVAVSREQVALPRTKISDERRQWCLDVLAEAETNPALGTVDGLPDEQYAQICLELYDLQDTDDSVEVMAMRIGDVGVVGLPGEIFCEFGMQIRQASPAAHTLVIELANGAIGYLPTREAFDQGGYEPTPGSTRYEPGAGDKLADSAVRQLRELFAS